MSSLLSLLRTANHLKSLPRTGWLFAGVVQPESLADHTCLVAIYALFLAEAVNADMEAQGLVSPLNLEKVLSLALLHDLAESVLTDLPKRSVEILGTEAKHQAEERVIVSLLTNLPRGGYYTTLWQEYDSGSTPEARLVKDVDKLEMVLQSVRYTERGQTNLGEFRTSHTWYYPISRSLFEEMVRDFSQ